MLKSSVTCLKIVLLTIPVPFSGRSNLVRRSLQYLFEDGLYPRVYILENTPGGGGYQLMSCGKKYEKAQRKRGKM